ncbi:MAG: hypothetical protein H7A25_23920 [Leptospiraceae bacterium]|nr:hypothetical protein [Leptospiraceae bacterium]
MAYSELPLYIGTVNGLNRYFNGKIDDIIIFNKALTDSEVLAIYNDTSEVRKNCKAILDDGLAHGDDVYMIDPDGVGGDAPFWAYCDMTTDGGGWTLALKADGNNDTFKYDAVYWENNDLFPANALDITPSLTKEEYKSPAFNTLDYSEIRLVMDTSGDVRELKIPLSQDSLKTMFQGGYIPTNFGRATWKAMVPDSSLQYNCNREGINNVIISSFAYAYSVRLGFITNQENDCGSPDGVIGVGILPGLWNTVYTGNFSSGIFPSDNGVKVLYSFAYVWIR